MPLISVTRLRVRAWRFLPAFLLQAFRSSRQARRAAGNLGAKVLAEAHGTFWTATCWSDEAAMRAFMASGPHGRVMQRLRLWCDEAAVVHWEQQTAAVPTWDEAHLWLQAHGRRSKVLHPSPDHEAYRIPSPVERGSRAQVG